MNRMALLLSLLAGCWGDNAYIMEGTVVEVREQVVVVDHEDIPGLMGPMVMPFNLRDPVALEPGDRIVARLMVEQQGSYLARVRVVGKGSVPSQMQGPAPVRPGEAFPKTPVALASGDTLVLGEPGTSLLLTFAYTRCPMPEFCPAIVARLQALQPSLPGGARIVVVTIDPEGDTPEHLLAFSESTGAEQGRWDWARVDAELLPALAMHAGLSVRVDGSEILHSVRFLAIDERGYLVERYDDTFWPMDRVISQLTDGKPSAPAGNSGTVSKPQVGTP